MKSSASMAWNSFVPLPSAGNRGHGAPPLPSSHPGMSPHGAHHHPGGPGSVAATPGIAAGSVVSSHPVSVAQQQQRERDEREARERDREVREREQREREREREHLAAAERLHRQVEARDYVAAQQRAAYYAATAPSSQQVYYCFVRVRESTIDFHLIVFRYLVRRVYLEKWIIHRPRLIRGRLNLRYRW